jgi:hypothetical protein
MLMHDIFEGKVIKINLGDHMHEIPIPKCAWAFFEWIWASLEHCSRMRLMHEVKIQIDAYTL